MCPFLPDPDSLSDLDDRERRIYARILNKVGDGPAAFFLDACRMMRAQPRPMATSHLVGHCIREIESALRALLVPLARRASASHENLRLRQIREMLAAAKIDEFDPQAEWWFREFLWFSYYYQTHRGNTLWATNALKGVLEAGVPLSDSRVVEKLARIAAEEPQLAFECYALLITHDHRDRLLVHEERGRDILRAALASPAARAARNLIHALGSEGILTFRDLLDETGADLGQPTEPE